MHADKPIFFLAITRSHDTIRHLRGRVMWKWWLSAAKKVLTFSLTPNRNAPIDAQVHKNFTHSLCTVLSTTLGRTILMPHVMLACCLYACLSACLSVCLSVCLSDTKKSYHVHAILLTLESNASREIKSQQPYVYRFISINQPFPV